MKIKELITKLSEFDQELEVMILDSFNGGGVPRDINYGPYGALSHYPPGSDEYEDSKYLIHEDHAEAAADCEGRVGESIVIMGYGSY